MDTNLIMRCDNYYISAGKKFLRRKKNEIFKQTNKHIDSRC